MRKITVISQREQRRTTFEADVKTVSDLKRELNNRNISTDNMTFKEIFSKGVYEDDDAVFPESSIYNGNVITELVVVVTYKQNLIKSGLNIEIDSNRLSRKQLYEYISDKGYVSDIENYQGMLLDDMTADEIVEYLDYVKAKEEFHKNNMKHIEDDISSDELVSVIIVNYDLSKSKVLIKSISKGDLESKLFNRLPNSETESCIDSKDLNKILNNF